MVNFDREAAKRKFDNFTNEKEKIRDLLVEMDKYLDTNKHTSISHGSIFHQQIKGLIKG